MKYDIIHIITIAILLCFTTNSCRAKKNLERGEEIQVRTERVEQSSDSARIEENKAEKITQHADEHDQSYTRVTEYDRTGTIVRRVSEVWRDRRSADMAIRDHVSTTVSVTGSDKTVLDQDSSSTIVSEIKHVQSDSRPVQGFEWIWVAMGLIAIGLILIFWQKLK